MGNGSKGKRLVGMSCVVLLLFLVWGGQGGWAAGSQPSCPQPKQVKGFLTCADVEKAEQEGGLVYYGTQYERWMIAMLRDFGQLFPKIDTSKYLSAQAGRVYAKIAAERRAGVYGVDVLMLSDVVIAREFQKNGGYVQYVSPYLGDLDAQFQSDPPGYFTWYALAPIGFAYNTNLVKEAEAPKSYKDLLDPKWRGNINFRDSASGFQALQWLMLRKLYGEQYWKEMLAQKPRGLASGSQQTERVTRGEEKINAICQWGTFYEFKQKGAPLGFVFPSDAIMVPPEVKGVVDKAPHPEAAKLFIDWILSPLGQESYRRISNYHAVRKDLPPPPGAKALAELKIWIPNFDELTQLHSQYVQDWNNLVGMPAPR